MKIKINGRKFDIKKSHDMTVSEYFAFLNSEKFDIASLLSVLTGQEYSAVLESKMNNFKAEQLSRLIGDVKSVDTFLQNKVKPEFFLYSGKLYDTRKFNWQAIGTRILLEQRLKQTEKVHELSVYLLAVLIDDTFDNESIEYVYEDLLEMNYEEVMYFACFFFRNFQTGQSNARSILKRIKQTIRMRFITKQQVRTH